MLEYYSTYVPLGCALVSPKIALFPCTKLAPNFKSSSIRPQTVIASSPCLRLVHLRCACLNCFMRLFHVLPILTLLFGAHAFSRDSRQSNAHPLDARDFSDVCAILDPSPMDLYLYASFWGSNVYGQFDAPFFSTISSVLSVIIMLIDSCLCLSQVSQLLEGNSNLADEFDDPATTLTDYVRRKVAVPLKLSDRISI